MATVLVSKQFIEDVKDVILQMRNDEFKFKNLVDCNLLELPQYIKPRFLETIAWGDHAHLRDQMPKQWVKTTESRMDFHLLVSEKKKLALTVTFPRGAATMPPLYNSYHDHEITVDMLYNNAKYGHCPDHPLVAEAFEKVILKNELASKWMSTTMAVVDFFTACPSVNKALALQPSMMVYVPKKYIDKVEAQIERKKREIPEIDAAALAAQAVEMQLARSIHGGA